MPSLALGQTNAAKERPHLTAEHAGERAGQYLAAGADGRLGREGGSRGHEGRDNEGTEHPGSRELRGEDRRDLCGRSQLVDLKRLRAKLRQIQDLFRIAL
eukprot:scaffold304_cov248-Pinguiococcus_pyrenoidosus.AAC.19